MANDNKKINELVSEQDDDPTAELELLSVAVDSESDDVQQVEAESDANTFDFDKLESEIGDSDESIAGLKSDLKLRAKNISKLQFDMEHLRSRWVGLEKEIKVREEVTENLSEELRVANKKQARTDNLLKRRQSRIESLKSQLSSKERSLKQSVKKMAKTRDKERASESRALDLQTQLDVTEEKLATLTTALELENSEKERAVEQAELLSVEVENLNTELIAARASVSETEQYIDRRKSDWGKQEAQLHAAEDSIRQLSKKLEDANTELRNRQTVHDDLKVMLELLNEERDELLKKIARLREDTRDAVASRATEDKKLLTEQTGMLAGKNFEISKLENQITRRETYADGLRHQLQNQQSLASELHARQKPLEASLADANAKILELSENILQLRNNNADLASDKSKLEDDLKNELERIRLELDEAKATVAENESTNAQLHSNLAEAGKFTVGIETRLIETETESKRAISKLNKNLNRVGKLNEELTRKLGNKEDAIRGLLKELTKRSQAIESIGEIGDVIHELDDRISERIDDKSNVERDRMTRLLIGKIDGQKLRFPLFKNRLTIGRTGHNDIQLKAPHISRRHAVIVSDADSTRIVDWGSKNGVFVNTEQIKEKILRNGDIVTIGTADFKFEERPKR